VALRRWIYSDSVTHVSKGRVLFFILLADIMSNHNIYGVSIEIIYCLRDLIWGADCYSLKR